MQRVLFVLGSTALLLAACHSSGPPGDMGQDPGTMMYRPTPTLHQRVAVPSCAAPVVQQSTSSACRSAQ